MSRKKLPRYALSTPLVRSWGEAMLEALDLAGAELSVRLTDDAEIHALNRQHRDKDKPTDVLSFPMSDEAPEEARGAILGDVVISLDTAARQAASRGRELAPEVRFLLAHGVLHLIGYDHATPSEKREMVGMTRRLVRAAAAVENAGPRPARSAGQGARATPRSVSKRSAKARSKAPAASNAPRARSSRR